MKMAPEHVDAACSPHHEGVQFVANTLKSTFTIWSVKFRKCIVIHYPHS
jgi:hypothetical protein